MSFRLSFYGGAGKVTGSNFLVEGMAGKYWLTVALNREMILAKRDVYAPFPYEVEKIDALVLTHAHLDHVGRIPRLVKSGFRGKIFMTPPTKDLAELILRDSVGILGQDAERRGIEPLYEEKDVDETLSLIETLDYHVEKEVARTLSLSAQHRPHPRFGERSDKR